MALTEEQETQTTSDDAGQLSFESPDLEPTAPGVVGGSASDVVASVSSGSSGSGVNVAVLATLGVGLVMSLVGCVGWGWRVSTGVFVGASLATFNLWVFGWVVRGLLSSSGSSRVSWSLLSVFKVAVLLLLVGLLIRFDIVGAIPLVIGYVALPVGITVSVLFCRDPAASEPR